MTEEQFTEWILGYMNSNGLNEVIVGKYITVICESNITSYYVIETHPTMYAFNLKDIKDTMDPNWFIFDNEEEVKNQRKEHLDLYPQLEKESSFVINKITSSYCEKRAMKINE